MVKKALLYGLFFILFALSAQANDDMPLAVTVHSDTVMYDDVEHVEIEVRVTNNNSKIQSFLLYDYEYSTFQPVVYDMTGREALTKVPYRLSGYSVDMMIKNEKPRKIEIKPDESFVKRINLADYYELEKNKKYRIRVLFLPDALQRSAFGSKNRYYLTIKKNTSTESYDENGFSYSGKTELRPGEVIHLFLNAEKGERWRDYVKYIDAERYIYSYPDFAQSYISASEAVQKKVINDFIQSLIEPRPDNLLDFSVEEETVTGSRAVVIAVAKRASAGRPFIYTYTYSLEKRGAIWKVIGVEAAVSRRRFAP